MKQESTVIWNQIPWVRMLAPVAPVLCDLGLVRWTSPPVLPQFLYIVQMVIAPTERQTRLSILTTLYARVGALLGPLGVEG